MRTEKRTIIIITNIRLSLQIHVLAAGSTWYGDEELDGIPVSMVADLGVADAAVRYQATR